MRFASRPSLVEVTGFEPAASCSQSRRATICATPRDIDDVYLRKQQSCNSALVIVRDFPEKVKEKGGLVKTKIF